MEWSGKLNSDRYLPPSRLENRGRERRKRCRRGPGLRHGLKNLVFFSLTKPFWWNDDCLLGPEICPALLRKVIRCERCPQWT